MTINPTIKTNGSTPSKLKPTLKLDNFIDPRELSKYLDLLQAFPTQSEKETQIINWYYTEEINLLLKEALMVILGKLKQFLSQAENKVKTSNESGDKDLALGIKQLHKAVKDHNFENIDKIRDTILKRLKNDNYKSEIYNFTGEIYRNLGILNKGISNFKKSLEYNPSNFSAIINLARMFISTEQHDQAEVLIIDSVKLFKKKNTGNLPELLNLLSQSKIYSSKFLEAKQILLEVRSMPISNPDLVKLVDINLALVLVQNFELVEAWKMINLVGKAIDSNFDGEIAKSLQHSQIPFLYNTIALYYAVNNQFDKAKNFAQKSIQIDELLGNSKFSKPYHFLVIGNNLAYLSIYLADFESFYKYNQIVRDISIDFFESNSFAFAKSYANQGIMNLIQGNKDLAFQSFFRSFHLLVQHTDNVHRSQLIRCAVYCDIGNVFCWKKDFVQAKIYYQKAKQILEELFGKSNLNLQRINSKLKNMETGKNIVLPF